MTNNGWLESSIGDLCKFTNGRGFTPAEWSDKGLPIIRIQNLNGSTDFNYYEGETEDRWVVLPDDILFAWAGTKGVSFGATIWKGSRGVLNQHIYRVHPKNGIDRTWLYYALQLVTSRIEKKAHGFKSTLLHVQKADITRQPISVPPLPEQTKIAAILLTWETAIKQTEKIIAASINRKRGLMQQLLTGKKRFQEFAKQKVTKVNLGSYITEVNSKSSSPSVGKVLSVTNTKGFVEQTEHFSRSVASKDLSNYKLIRRGQFGYNPSRINVGSVALLTRFDEGLLSPLYIIFQVQAGHLDSSYLTYFFQTHAFSSQLKSALQGSVRDSLSFSALSQMKIWLPSHEEQQRIGAMLETCDQEIELLRKQLAALKRQKRGLMQKLLTGQIRVKVAQEAAS